MRHLAHLLASDIDQSASDDKRTSLSRQTRQLTREVKLKNVPVDTLMANYFGTHIEVSNVAIKTCYLCLRSHTFPVLTAHFA